MAVAEIGEPSWGTLNPAAQPSVFEGVCCHGLEIGTLLPRNFLHLELGGTNSEPDEAYFARRAKEEEQAAARAGTATGADIHRMLAGKYASLAAKAAAASGQNKKDQ